jgi:hypothetical protein
MNVKFSNSTDASVLLQLKYLNYFLVCLGHIQGYVDRISSLR